jgi:hypothetical protein
MALKKDSPRRIHCTRRNPGLSRRGLAGAREDEACLKSLFCKPEEATPQPAHRLACDPQMRRIDRAGTADPPAPAAASPWPTRARTRDLSRIIQGTEIFGMPSFIRRPIQPGLKGRGDTKAIGKNKSTRCRAASCASRPDTSIQATQPVMYWMLFSCRWPKTVINYRTSIVPMTYWWATLPLLPTLLGMFGYLCIS